MPRVAPALFAVSLLLHGATAARADGRLPFVGQIVFHPTDPSTIVARATFGVLFSEDGGATWRWVCNAMLDTRPSEDPNITMTSDGTVIAATTKTLRVALPGLCKWSSPSAELHSAHITDVVRDPTDPDRAVCATGTTALANGLYASPDNGQTWSVVGERLDFSELDSLRIAPSDPLRVYVSGRVPAAGATPRIVFVQRSVDGGELFDRFEITLAASERDVRVLGVDPTAPARLFARVVSLDGPDRLIRSDDGGEHWIDLLTAVDLAGFAWSADGATVWVGSRAGGLWRSDDRGMSFSPLPGSPRVSCLEVRGDELWVCASDLVDGFAIGRSVDAGLTITPVLRLRELAGLVSCDPSLGIADLCAFEVADLQIHLAALDGGVAGIDGGSALDAGRVSRDDGSMAPDAGALVGARPGGGGCTCRAARARTPRSTALVAVVGALLAVAVRQRRRRC